MYIYKEFNDPINELGHKHNEMKKYASNIEKNELRRCYICTMLPLVFQCQFRCVTLSISDWHPIIRAKEQRDHY